MVCRNCQQVFSLTAGIECPMCHSPLYMSVFVEEASQQNMHADAANTLPDSIKEALNSGDGVYRP